MFFLLDVGVYWCYSAHYDLMLSARLSAKINWYCTFVTARCILMQSGTSVSVCVTLPVLWSSSSFNDSTDEAVNYVNQMVFGVLNFPREIISYKQITQS